MLNFNFFPETMSFNANAEGGVRCPC